ncbi:MAG: hypothetical protein WC341_03515 [Bacteroidales bacterium]|jgi:surface polysaccharide O-acyltransferase-like enzyme
MKTLKGISFLAFAVTIIAIFISLINLPQKQNSEDIQSIYYPYTTEIAMATEDIKKTIDKMQDLNVLSSDSNLTEVENKRLRTEFSMQMKDLEENIKPLEETVTKPTKGSDISLVTLYFKMGFSAIFCFAALYVVLSNKYDENTKKWAFSVLSLIAGIWIGSVS